MSGDSTDHDSDSATDGIGQSRISRRGVLAATGGTIAASTFAGLASARSDSGLVQIELAEPLGRSSPSSPIAPTDGFADTDWMTEGPLTVVPVTTLDATGEGSISHAMTRDIHDDSEGRIVVFEVGGVIDLAENDGELDPETDNVYVAGQTAPEPGITLVRGTFELDGENIFVQHIRARSGTDVFAGASGEGDAADTMAVADESENVIVDHCTATWGTDENLSSGDTASNITFSNNLIAHGLAEPDLHPDEGEHSNGTLIGHDTVGMAVLGNLYAHNNDRHPRPKGGTQTVVANNVVYNFDTAVRLGDDAEIYESTIASIVGNVYRPGDNTPSDDPIVAPDEDDPVWVYLDDNVTQGPLSMLADEPSSNLHVVDDRIVWPVDFEAIAGDDTFGSVTETAGAHPARRVDYDDQIVRQTKARKGQIIDSEEEVGGYPDHQGVTRQLDVPADNFASWLERHTRAVETGE